MGLLLNSKKIGKNSIVCILLVSFSILFLSLFNLHLNFLINYTEYILFLIGLFIFILTLIQLKKSVDIGYLTFIGIILSSYTLVILFLLSLPANLDFNNSILIFILLLVFALLSLKLTKGCDFKGMISEYLILESLLLMILGGTYPYVKTLKYEEFLPFTILTPNFELIILVILIFVLLFVGVLLNDYRKIK